MIIAYNIELKQYMDENGEIQLPATNEQAGGWNREILMKPETIMWFGKYKDKNLSLANIVELDPKYIYWLFDKEFNLSKELRKLSNQNTAKRRNEHIKQAGELGSNVVRIPSLFVDKALKRIKENLDEHMFSKHPEIFDEEWEENVAGFGSPDIELSDCIDLGF